MHIHATLQRGDLPTGIMDESEVRSFRGMGSRATLVSPLAKADGGFDEVVAPTTFRDGYHSCDRDK